MGSTFGKKFQLHSFGESHGRAVGGMIEGCPGGFPIDIDHIQHQLDRRRPGQSTIASPRKEHDTIQILSGVFEGKALGSPIGFLIVNKDADPKAYQKFKDKYRPSHADYTYTQKYGHRDWRGGGRSSARETIARVAAGALGQQLLKQQTQIEIVAYVQQIGHIHTTVDHSALTQDQVDEHPTRCPDLQSAQAMQQLIESVRAENDTVGGVIKCVCRNVPVGLGEPVFDKLEADLAKAMMSIPASKGFAIGSGFSAASMRGSQHNDPFTITNGQVKTSSNHSGGIQGGISNGMNIEFEVVFKPVSTIFKPQQTVDTTGQNCTISPRGRHDPCVLPRAVPIVEAMAALVLCDHWLRHISG